MNVADNLVKIMEEEGITEVFGIPGEQIMPLYRALSQSDIRHILTRHEQAAAQVQTNVDQRAHQTTEAQRSETEEYDMDDGQSRGSYSGSRNRKKKDKNC